MHYRITWGVLLINIFWQWQFNAVTAVTVFFADGRTDQRETGGSEDQDAGETPQNKTQNTKQKTKQNTDTGSHRQGPGT